MSERTYNPFEASITEWVLSVYIVPFPCWIFKYLDNRIQLLNTNAQHFALFRRFQFTSEMASFVQKYLAYRSIFYPIFNPAKPWIPYFQSRFLIHLSNDRLCEALSGFNMPTWKRKATPIRILAILYKNSLLIIVEHTHIHYLCFYRTCHEFTFFSL